jgi:hypothetical protein
VLNGLKEVTSERANVKAWADKVSMLSLLLNCDRQGLGSCTGRKQPRRWEERFEHNR